MQWCSDWYGSYAGDATDPRGPASGTDRVLRGGSWMDKASCCTSAYRKAHAPDYRNNTIGFRVCRDLDPDEGPKR